VVAVSILAVGLMAEKRISALTVRLVSLEKQVSIIRADMKRTVIALEYAHSKADSTGRAGIGATGRQIWEGPSLWGSKLFRPEKTSKTNGRTFFGFR